MEPAAVGAETRARLLDAAERLFAERGFARASVRDITAAARTNIASVSYHFGGKERLYQEVFQRRVRALRAQRLETLARAGTPAPGHARLVAVLAAFAEVFLAPLAEGARGRAWASLMLREHLDPHLPAGMLEAELMGPVRQALAAAIRACAPRLQDEEARRCAQSFAGQLLHLYRVGGAWRAEGNAALAAEARHVVRFSAAAIHALAAMTDDGEGESHG